MMHDAVSVGVSGQPGFGNRCCQRAAFFGVILSDERREESKDPYIAVSSRPEQGPAVRRYRGPQFLHPSGGYCW